MFLLGCVGGNKQKWVPLNIEPPSRPPPSRGYYRHRGESRDHWHSYGRRDKDREFDRDRRERGRDGGGRFERGRDRVHKPLRFERDHGYKSRDHTHHQRGDHFGDRYEEQDNGYSGRGGNWQVGGGDGDERSWQYPVAPGKNCILVVSSR